MKRFALFLLTLLIFLCARAETGYDVGDTVPDFSVKLTDGSEWRLSEALQNRKMALINFWFIKCPWCMVEFPELNGAYEKYAEEAAVIALNDIDGADEIKAFLENSPYSMPMAQADAALSAAFGVTSYPTTVVIDRNGVLCGYYSTQPDNGAFDRLFEAFTADGYTDPLINYEIPAPEITAPIPDGDALSRAINSDGFDCEWFFPYIDAWPFVEGESGLVSSNRLTDTVSAIAGIFSAEAGSVFALDYDLSAGSGDVLEIFIDDSPVTAEAEIQTSGVITSPISESGTHSVIVAYMKNLSYRADPEEFTDCAVIRNARLLTGPEAEKATLEYQNAHTARLVPEDAGVREIVVEGGLAGTMEDYYDEVRFFIAPESMRFRLEAGENVRASAVVCVSAENGPVSVLQNGKDGDFADPTPFAREEASAKCPYATVLLQYQTTTETKSGLYTILLEGGDVNAFAESMRNSEDEAFSWHIEGGNYAFSFRDQFQNPVAGVLATVCADGMCAPVVSDESGFAVYDGAPGTYDVHIFVPEGYALDGETEFQTASTYETYRFTLIKE